MNVVLMHQKSACPTCDIKAQQHGFVKKWSAFCPDCHRLLRCSSTPRERFLDARRVFCTRCEHACTAGEAYATAFRRGKQHGTVCCPFCGGKEFEWQKMNREGAFEPHTFESIDQTEWSAQCTNCGRDIMHVEPQHTEIDSGTVTHWWDLRCPDCGHRMRVFVD